MKSASTENAGGKTHKRKQSRQSKAESKAIRPTSVVEEEFDEVSDAADVDQYCDDYLFEGLVDEMQIKIADRIRNGTSILPADILALWGDVAIKLTGLAPWVLIRFLTRVEQQCLVDARKARLELQELDDADDDRAEEAADNESKARSAVTFAAEALGRARAMFPANAMP